jgi:hypothetical protein
MKALVWGISMGVLIVSLVSGGAGPAAKEPQTPLKPQRDLQPITPRQSPQRQAIDFPEAPPTAVVEVLGDVPGVDFSTWQNTGVSLQYGDVLYIRADGQVNYVTNLTVGPDGRGDTFPPSLLPSISFASLVGRTHWALLDDGIDSSRNGVYGPGFVGAEFKMVYHGRSEYGLTGDNVLYPAVNDSMGNDNTLSFTARIWVVRDGKVIDGKGDHSNRLMAAGNSNAVLP